MAKSQKSKAKIKTIVQNIFIYIVYAIGAALFLLIQRSGDVGSSIRMASIYTCMISALLAAVACSRFNRHHVISVISFVIVVILGEIIFFESSRAELSEMTTPVLMVLARLGFFAAAQLTIQLVACPLINAIKEIFIIDPSTKATPTKKTPTKKAPTKKVRKK